MDKYYEIPITHEFKLYLHPVQRKMIADIFTQKSQEYARGLDETVIMEVSPRLANQKRKKREEMKCSKRFKYR